MNQQRRLLWEDPKERVRRKLAAQRLRNPHAHIVGEVEDDYGLARFRSAPQDELRR